MSASNTDKNGTGYGTPNGKPAVEGADITIGPYNKPGKMIGGVASEHK